MVLCVLQLWGCKSESNDSLAKIQLRHVQHSPAEESAIKRYRNLKLIEYVDMSICVLKPEQYSPTWLADALEWNGIKFWATLAEHFESGERTVSLVIGPKTGAASLPNDGVIPIDVGENKYMHVLEVADLKSERLVGQKGLAAVKNAIVVHTCGYASLLIWFDVSGQLKSSKVDL